MNRSSRMGGRIEYSPIQLEPSQIDRRAYFLLAPDHPDAFGFQEAAERLVATCGRRRVLWGTAVGGRRGCSLITLNLATALAIEHRVALVDIRFDSPALAMLLGCEDAPLTEKAFVARQSDLNSSIRVGTIGANLAILVAQGGIGNEIYLSPGFRSILEDLRRTCDYVFLDGPPIRSLLEREALLMKVDGVVLTVTPDDLASGAYESTMQLIPAEQLVGCVMNELDT
ncbi:MAG: hypothetical protein VX589_08250 [Myxococcota bacterium]|nr:hypothetical protein [Myxococcota bacterium]